MTRVILSSQSPRERTSQRRTSAELKARHGVPKSSSSAFCRRCRSNSGAFACPLWAGRVVAADRVSVDV